MLYGMAKPQTNITCQPGLISSCFYVYFAGMNVPAISVILPVYNCEKYIGKAIDSVLRQTFTDFELILINDGSTDQSENIILSFTDPRIVYIKNEKNCGLIYTLNRGIEQAKGKYIARMDADDVCMPERLAKQKLFLDEHDEIAMVASTVNFIDEHDREKGSWPLDRKTISPFSIRKVMPYENCIAHPSVMIRSDIIKKLQYKEYQKNIEDYDLWLRMLNCGMNIAKIEEPLLLYRLHGDSVTTIHLKSKNVFFTHSRMKRKFLAGEISSGRLNLFTFRVMLAAKLDILSGIGKALKNLFK
jgi:glycosyltransferase involved in cell wall biosynthesis